MSLASRRPPLLSSLPSFRAPVLALMALLSHSSLLAASSLEIRVQDAKGQPLPGAIVAVPGTGREALAGVDGVARLDNLPAGAYDLTVRLSGFVTRRLEVEVKDGSPAAATVTLADALHFSESVTVSPNGRDTFESYQPASVIGGVDLLEKVHGNLGQTLQNELGVNVRAFGPGPSRPVVRGLDGDRVLVLENGARTGDLSSQSADHGVTLDPANAEQIDVVRGPATLLYGSNALGGVVNLVGDEIPVKPVTGAHGSALLQGATGDSSGSAAGHLVGGNGRFAWRAEGSYLNTGDTRTPEGDLANSDAETRSIGGSLAVTGDKGYLGASYQWVETEYGLPIVEEGQVRLNPRRHRVDVRGERRGLDSFIEGVKLVGGFRDYRHEELVAGEVGTVFHNKFYEGNLYLNQRPTGRLKGTIGFWSSHRDYTSAGEEALAPATTAGTFAAFAYEELSWRHFGLQLGLRYDHASFDPTFTPAAEQGEESRPPARDRQFDNVSASIGFLGYLTDEVTLAVNFASAARNPSLEELYNFGPHPGNFAFEVGDTELGTERGNGLDVSFRVRKPRFVLEVTGFYNRIDGFIFPFQTGQVEDEFPVVEYGQADSTLKGLEAHVDLGLGGGLWLELGGDSVHGELRRSGDPLPRMPPFRLWGGLRYEKGRWHAEGVVRYAGEQDRVYGFETPTGGYTLVNVHASYSLPAGRTTHTLTVRLDNVLDETYRNHLNYIKDLTPEMGFSGRLVYALRF